MIKFLQLLVFLIAPPKLIVHGYSLPSPRIQISKCHFLDNKVDNVMMVHQPKKSPKKDNTCPRVQQQSRLAAVTLVAGIFFFCLTSTTAIAPALAAADFANQDISGQDFSGQDLSGKDFSGVIAKSTNFHNANLQKSLFIKANLVRADFSGANLREASFVDSTLDGASFKNAVAQGAVFSPSILDIGDLENVDLTNSMWPSKLRIMICDMDELKGTNPATGIVSRDSIMCTDYTHSS